MAEPAKPEDEPVPPPPQDVDAKPSTPPKSAAKSIREGKELNSQAQVDLFCRSPDVALAKLGHEKKLSFIKAWEDSEKAKTENRAEKRRSKVNSWENSKKASLEAELKAMEEQLERKRAEFAEKVKNKEALIHKLAEEKRAVVEAKKGEDLLKAEEMASKFRSTGQMPKSGFKLFRH